MELELGQSSIWENPEYAQALGKEQSSLEAIVHTMEKLYNGIGELEQLLTLAQEECDQELFIAASNDLDQLQERLEALEFRRMFSGAMDSANAYVDIQAGSGGTEAQDWAEMLLRMYLRWGEEKGSVWRRYRWYKECHHLFHWGVRLRLVKDRNRSASIGAKITF